MDITIKVQLAPETINAIKHLLESLLAPAVPVQCCGGVLVESDTETTPAAPATPATPAAPAAPAASAAPASVPLAAPPKFTFDQLAQAGASLCQTPEGQKKAQDVLKQFNIQSLKDLLEQRYGEFALALRQAGAAL